MARSTCRSENVQRTTMVGPLLEVEMSKKCTYCTPLWREAHFQVKMLKTLGVRTTFGGLDVEKVHEVVARSTFRSQNVKNTRGSDHFCFGGSDVASLRFITLHYITLHYTPLHYTTLHYTHYTPQRYTPLHSTTLNYTPLHSTTLHYTKLHYTTLHYTTLHSTTLHYTTLHYLSLHFTSLHYITLHSTTLQIQLQLHNYTATLHYTPLR